MVLSISLVTVIYILANVAYMAVLSVPDILSTTAIAMVTAPRRNTPVTIATNELAHIQRGHIHKIIITNTILQNNVITSFWRNDVFIICPRGLGRKLRRGDIWVMLGQRPSHEICYLDQKESRYKWRTGQTEGQVDFQLGISYVRSYLFACRNAHIFIAVHT